uniref:NADH dehydrogenase subunit 6 n=1 Tax=Dielis plumipes fossulana TaxID=2977626 RepID=A0A1W5LJM8_9HYME|nr:NADH dehydrogenase subunit 6 [Dielis plumipes fossulana]
MYNIMNSSLFLLYMYFILNVNMFIIFIMCFFFPYKHPMEMCIYLSIFITMILIITGSNMSSFIYSFLIFMIMVGGLMVMFLYFSSSASMSKSNTMIKLKYLITLFLIMFISTMLIFYYLYNLSMFNFKDELWMMSINNELDIFKTMEKIYKLNYTFISTMSIVFLFIFMLSIVKVCKMWKVLSIRQKYNK